MSSLALYYPWMHFQSDDWLKVALLGWQKIARVRSEGVEDRDSEMVRQVRAESDLLMEIVPSGDELDVVAQAFYEVLELAASDDSGFRRRPLGARVPFAPAWARSAVDAEATRYRQPPSQVPPVSGAPGHGEATRYRQPPWQRMPPVSGAPGHGDSGHGAPGHGDSGFDALSWVYCGRWSKITYALSRDLVDAGLAVRRGGREPWLGMHPKLASVYMAALTDAMAQRNALSPVTDDPRMHRATGALDHLARLLGEERPVSGPGAAEAWGAYLHLAISASLQPRGISDVPVSRLLAFRDRHADELAAFHEHIDSLSAELETVAKVENPEVARAHLKSLYDRTTKRHLSELRAALKAFGIESTVGTLELKCDIGTASTTALGAAAALGGQAGLAGAAFAASVVPYAVRQLRARERQRAQSPVAYLLAAGEEFGRKRRFRS